MTSSEGEPAEPRLGAEAALSRIAVSADDLAAAKRAPAGTPASEEAYLQGVRDSELRSRDLDVEIKRQELELKKEELRLRREDREKRREFADKIFGLIKLWLLGMGLVVVWSGFTPFRLALPSAVLVALVTTTNGAILGLFVLVAAYFFYRPKDERKSADDKPRGMVSDA